MENTNITTTTTSSSISSTSKRNNTTEETTTIIQPSILLSSPTVTPPSSPRTTIVETDYITAVGLCGVNGYEAEVNQTIGLCREARTDFNLLLTVAKVQTRSYILRQKNRLMYACLTGNARWFRTLFRMTGKIDIVSLRTRQNQTLYHLVCTLPKAKYNDITLRYEESPTVPDRLQILNTLLTTQIDIHVKTNTTKKQTAFDIVTEVFPIDEQLLQWWLDHIDRFDIENLNQFLPWLAFDNRLEAVQCLCRNESMDLNLPDIDGDTALIMAAYKGHTSIVGELLTYYPERLTATHLNHLNSWGNSALNRACKYNHLTTAQALCRHPDVYLNEDNEDGKAPLYIAAEKGYTDILHTLLQYVPDRVDINQRAKDGTSPMGIVRSKGNTEIIDVLRNHGGLD